MVDERRYFTYLLFDAKHGHERNASRGVDMHKIDFYCGSVRYVR